MQLREISKNLAARVPLTWVETIANYSVCRARPDFQAPEILVGDRLAYFKQVAKLADVGSDKPLTYFEFGVHKGESIRQWTSLNRHPESRFYGFDSFVGLPETWRSRKPGYFDTQGQVPRIDDPRVSFVKGWFNATLPDFRQRHPIPPKHKILVHIDSDLYSAALYCLVVLGQHLRTFPLLFDEFGAGEARALKDVLSAFGGGFTPVLALKRTHSSTIPTRMFGELRFGPKTSDCPDTV